MRGGPSIGNRLAPARFLVFLGVLGVATIISAIFWRHGFDWHSALIGFDVAAAVFLASVIPLLDDQPGEMRQHAAENDANRIALLAITVVLAIVILVAIGSIIRVSQHLVAWEVAIIVVTLVLAWAFANVMFALHYAHMFYQASGEADRGGLEMPGTEEPDYWDFFYFSFTLGMTFQTSDVSISGRQMRRVVLLQCFAAFLFNMGILAFTVNALGGL
jgi:uncharacterized membrane protein